VRKLKIGSLFAGIGGFDLGLERTGGFETAWFCEIEDYPTKILNKNWPGVPVYPDVTQLKGDTVAPVDILTGGFPCQDISAAGRGAGIDGDRSGLWFEFARVIGELRPRYVIAENSPLLRSRGLNAVLGSLAALGYDAEWDCVPARAFGAPHQRDRIWVVAYTEDYRPHSSPGPQGRELPCEPCPEDPERCDACGGWPVGGVPTHSNDERTGRGCEWAKACSPAGSTYFWPAEPDLPRVDDGVPNRVDRIKCLGNALIPPIPEWIGHRILAWEAGEASTVTNGNVAGSRHAGERRNHEN
jgi:DNA (cytosine-5)-methyltransferase 1